MKIQIKQLLLVLLMTACSFQNKREHNKNIEELNISENTTCDSSVNLAIDFTKIGYAKESLASYRFVRLESADNALIGDVKKAVVKNDRIIMKSAEETLCIFGMDGKLLNVIDGLGQGPDEYFVFRDFGMFDSTIYIYDATGKILTYDLNGDFKDVFKVPSSCDYVSVNEQGIYLNDSDPDYLRYRVVCIDKADNIKKELFQVKEDIRDGSSNLADPFSVSEKEIIVPFSFEPNKLLVFDKNFNSQYKLNVDYGSKNLPDHLKRENNIENPEYLMSIINHDPSLVWGVEKIFKVNNWICLFPSSLGSPDIFKNMKTGAQISTSKKSGNSPLYYVSDIIGVNGEQFIGVIKPNQIVDALETISKLKDKAEYEKDLINLGLDYEDNPVLCFFTLDNNE